MPLRLATYFGLATSFITVVIMVGYAFIRLILHAAWPAGFTTLAALILISISINAMLLGIIGEYLGRMYRQVREGPLTLSVHRPAAATLTGTVRSVKPVPARIHPDTLPENSADVLRTATCGR